LERGAPPPHQEEVAVEALLADLRGEIESISGGRHTIDMESDGPPHLLGSSKELRSAFGNLAGNAVRYTPPGGHVRLCWKACEDGGAEFSVSDDGPGIAAEHLPRLTERFYRVDRG